MIFKRSYFFYVSRWKLNPVTGQHEATGYSHKLAETKRFKRSTPTQALNAVMEKLKEEFPGEDFLVEYMARV